VLTDRLHGMVFAAITATPCIVIKSKSHKLQGCYKWIEHLEYVKFINEIPDIDVFCDNVVGKSYQYDNKSLVPYYEEIKKIVYDAVRKK